VTGEGHVVAEFLQPANRLTLKVCTVPTIEVIHSEFVVLHTVLEHVVDDRDDRVGHCHECLLPFESLREVTELGTEVRGGVAGRPGCFDQRLLQMPVAFARP